MKLPARYFKDNLNDINWKHFNVIQSYSVSQLHMQLPLLFILLLFLFTRSLKGSEWGLCWHRRLPFTFTIYIYKRDLLRLSQIDSIINDLAWGTQTNDDAV